jgi:hypothetical protein|tara:strand:- start:3452 stop:3598 length:147 start_codon:yes stop_codon:yes gene_type:complete
MIKNIIEILSIDPFFNASKEVQIAKGINTLPKNFKGVREQIKRQLKNK